MAKYVLSALSALVCVQSVISISDGDVQCEKPPEFERSRPCKQYEEFPVGTSVKYCCDHGFRFSSGVRSATCEFDNSKGVAEWKVPVHSCQAVSCSPPETIENGRFLGSRYTFPNSVKYECNKGYKLQGSTVRFCETTGEWSGRKPRCQIVTCPKPENIEKGKVTYLSTEYASTVKYECETGYRVEGKSERRCTHEGVWDGDEPTCVEVVCPQPKDPVFGKVIVHGGTRKDSLISFTCDKDTQLIGESFAKCTEDGTWSADPPLCAKPCVVPVLGRGQMGIKERTWDRRSRQWIFTRVYPGTEFKHGDKLLLKCDKEFELPIEDLEPGEVEVICNSGTFNPSPACHPAWCRGPLPNNGRGTPPSPPYNKENGSLVIYEDPCRGIGEIRRRKTALCYRGRWIVTDEICHDPRCKGEELEKFYVKAINGSEFYDDGEEVEVQCKNGYEKVSERGILCSNGEWQVTQHPCKPASCNYPPPEIDNGKAQISSHSHGVNVRYTCNPPYRLVPRGTIVCSNGQWIGKLPKCEIEPCTVPMLHRGKMGIKEHRGAREKFTQIHHDTKVQSGDKLLLRCNEEFELPVEDLPPGDVEVICDGGVLKPKPECHPAWCRGPLPDNGRGVPPPPPYNKENGSVVVYTDSCLNIGRTIQEKKALCVRGRWKIMDEECEDMRCNARDLENYYVDTSGQEYFGNRKVIEVQCKIGYEKTINDISCIDGHWQITSAPCKPAFCRYPPPNIEHGKAAVSSGEHGTNVDYTCFPPYELVSRGSVACSHGQWTGALPMCKDTRCNTYSLSVYDGVKAENKTIKSRELYTPSCRDGYGSLEVELQCYKGNWANSQRNPRFCKPGDCAVPYVVYGDFYTLKITYHWWRGEEREFEKVRPNSIATHNTVMYFRCRGGRKFQGRTETDGDGVQVICNLKQWTPKPECWYFPQTTTAAPTTIEQTTELQLDDGEAKVALENNTLGIGATENGTNEDEAEALHNLTLQEKNCKYENNDKHLLMFFEDQVISNGTLPEGSVMKFGCQPIGSARLHGGDSALCTNGEFKMSAYPECLMPSNKEDVTILFYTDKTYETRPGDVALVWKESLVEINCYNFLQESRPPQLYHRDLNKHIYGTEKSTPDGFRYVSIRIESMKEEYVGTYECSYGADSHRITLTLADAEGKTFCPSLNATDRLRINYDPDENQIVPGTRAIFSCKDVMSELLGETEIVCLKSGAWASSPPICVRKCWPTPEIENGYKEGDSFTVGSEVTYRCDRGYKLIGSSKLRCEENSLWSHNLPRCAEIRCPKPVDVANAVVYFTSLRFNAKVEYRCNKGYKLVGNSTSHCNENGKWTNRPPFCEEKPTQCNSNDLLDKLPEGVFGENITGEFMPSGSVIRLVCGHPSQIIIGDKYGNCTSAGYWRVGNTKCVIGCKAVEKPDDSSLIIGGLKDIYRFGDSVTFSCPAGEQLSLDLEVVLCLSTGWSDDRVPECLSPKQ